MFNIFVIVTFNHANYIYRDLFSICNIFFSHAFVINLIVYFHLSNM